MGGAYRGKGCKGTGFALKPGSLHRISPEVAHLGSRALHCSKLAFGRASTPITPQRVQTMRGPMVGTGT